MTNRRWSEERPSGVVVRPSYERGLTAGERARLQRERVIRGAAEAFAENTADRTKLIDITRRAHVSRRTVYVLFRGTDEIRVAAGEWMFSRAFADVARIAADAPAEERCARALAAVLRDLRDHGTYMPAVVRELHNRGLAGETMRRRFLGLLEALLGDAYAPMHRHALGGAILAVLFWFQDAREGPEPDEAVDVLVRLIASVTGSRNEQAPRAAGE
jgi:AcrR family transcriptional regulator